MQQKSHREPTGQHQPRHHLRNNLNDLDSHRWLLFTKSWFTPKQSPRRDGHTRQHPAKFPEPMVEDFLRFFTTSRRPQVILDPFCGTGTTLVTIDQLNQEQAQPARTGIGIELNPHYASTARNLTRQTIHTADAATMDLQDLPPLDFIITSPPYWNSLHAGTGHLNPQRQHQGLDTVYSQDPRDMGNIGPYPEFIRRTAQTVSRYTMLLRPGSFCVVILACVNRGERFYPLPYDFAHQLLLITDLQWRGERIWLQDNKPLMPYGYPYSFVSNIHHHTCLIFRQPTRPDETGEIKQEDPLP